MKKMFQILSMAFCLTLFCQCTPEAQTENEQQIEFADHADSEGLPNDGFND